jgi:transposase InsO family protein
MASRKKGASVSQGQALRVASRDRDTGEGGRQPSAALPETKMTSARKNVAKVTKSGVREKAARGTSRAKATKEPIQATPPRALRSRRAVTLQQSSADTESKEDAPDALTEDSFVEVQEPHKRQHQRTRSPDVQLEHRGEPAYIPTENERRWEPGQDRQQGNAVASGSSGLTNTAAEVHSSEDRYRPSSPRAQSSQPKGISRPEVVPSEGDTSRSRSRIQGGHPRSGDEEGWKQPKAIDGLRPEFVGGNPGGNSRGRDYANQASDQPNRLPVEENSISGPRRRSSSLDETYRGRNDARASEIRRWIGPSPYMDPCVRMPEFDGSGDIELFLHRFHVLSEFYCWDRREQLFRLQQCVRGDAQYMCMDLTSAEDVDDFKRVLRERFGTAGHAERYRAELSQLRRGEMTLEKLHLQIRALVSKVAPGPWTSLTEIYARDAFLNALDDDDLRRRILMTCPPPTTLAMAYDLALRSAALEPRVRCDHHSEDSWRSRSPAKRQQRRTRALITEKDDESPQNIQELTVANRRLQKQVEELQQRLQKFPAGKSCTETASVRPTVEPQSGKANIICFRCHKAGHMAKHCTEKLLRNAGLCSELQTNVISRMSAPGTKVYIQVGYGGKQYRVLLDTGCEISVLSTKVIPYLPYQKYEHKLLAANMSAVPILGKATIAFRLGPTVIESDFLVSEAIEELIFGADWLEENKCLWDFATENLIVRSTGSPLRVPLYGGCRNACVRRLYAGESVNLEPHSQRDLAVKTVWSTRPPLHADWMVEPVTLKPGVMLARTLLAESPEEAYVRVTNCNATAFCLEAGELLAIAEAVPRVGCLNLDEHHPKMQDTEQRLNIDEAETSDIDTEHGPQLPEHLKGLLESLPSTLTAEQRRRASKFLCGHANVFSTSNTDLGRNSMLPHRIDTGESAPIRQPLRRQPYAHLDEIEKNVQEMLKAKVIEPATSPWAANVLLVKKSDGSSRFCLDYRFLNKVTRRDCYPLPRIDTCLESLGGSVFFSTLDLRSGYWQTEIAEEDRDKTAFITRSGQYRFTVLSMGLANAPSQFQRLMDLVMAGLIWQACLVYLDDIIIFAPTFDLHLERLSAVFARLEGAGLKLKPSKCQLFACQVKFLGHIVSASGIEADPEKTRVVANWPRPRNLSELRSFVGLCSYYRRFVRHFASIAKPLSQLTEKNRPFEWSTAQEEAFQELKARLISAPILAAPMDNGLYVLDTDASLVGLGAVLQQEQGDHLKVISYASRTLTPTERNYSTTKRELLAVIYGLKQYRQFLLGRHFQLRVDHSALTFIRKTPEVMGQAARWMDLIEEFDFDITHRAGAQHGNCDSLSRRPEEHKGEETTAVARIQQSSESPRTEQEVELTLENIAEAQRNDINLRPFLNATLRPEWSVVQSSSEETRALWAQFDSLIMKNDVLYRKYYLASGEVQHLQIVMPTVLRKAFLTAIHSPPTQTATSHLGVKKTQQHVLQRAYWVRWKKDVETFCRRCPVCQTVKHGPAPRHGLMQTYEPNAFGDRLHVDLTGPHIPSRQGCTYIMTAIDAYTRFLIAVPIRHKSAEAVAQALVEKVFIPFGAWRVMVSDQGKDFNNSILDSVARLLGINKVRTTSYRPSSNGVVERVHRTLNNLMCTVVSEKQRDWQDRLPALVAAYNAAYHEGIGHSPYFLTYGREYVLALDVQLGQPCSADVHAVNQDEYAERLRERLQHAFEAVNERMHTRTERMKKRYDQRVKSFVMQPGDMAVYYRPHRIKGRNQKWRRLGQLCLVCARLNDVLYCAQLSPAGKRVVVHIDRLTKFNGDPPPEWKTAVEKLRREGTAQRTSNAGAGQNGQEATVQSDMPARRERSADTSETSIVPPRETPRGKQRHVSRATKYNDVNTMEEPHTADPRTKERRDRRTRRARRRDDLPPSAKSSVTESVTMPVTGGPSPDESCPAQERNSVPVVLTTVPHTCTSSKPQYQSSSAPGLKWANERPKREHKLPIRFRRTKLDCNLMGMDIDKVGKRKRRSDEQKKRRREFERGPWPCSYCDCAPYTSIAGYRDHMILVHKKSCSWTGVVGDFADDETAANVADHIRSQRAKKRRRTIGPTTSVEPERLASLELADQEITSASATQPDSGPSSMASESQPAGLSADQETSLIRLLVGSPSTTGVVGDMASYSDATWTPDPVMWEEWSTLLGPDIGAVISDAQPASTSDIVNGGVSIDQGQVSLHDESTMTDAIKCDVAVQVVPSCDASVQAVTTCYNSATQTSRGEARYLPNGVSLGRVLEEIQENPDLSLGQIRGRLLTGSQLPPSDDAIDLLNFVLFAMMQTRKDLISAVCNAQIEAGRLRERDPQAARVRLETTMAMVRCEMNRDLDVVSHTAAANVAVEEIERSPRSQSYGDSDCEVVSDDE